MTELGSSSSSEDPNYADPLPPKPSRRAAQKSVDDSGQLLGVKLGKQIGAGAFGAVFEGSWKGSDVAIKTISSGDTQELQSELDVLRQLNHPCIVRFFGLTDHAGEVGIVLELCANGSLDTALKSTTFSERELTRMCAQMARGLEYLADQGILHRDLAGLCVSLPELLKYPRRFLLTPRCRQQSTERAARC
jgi:serine/threonine protein kinase